MFMQYDSLPAKLEEEFSRPVESIMRCEDFKSNFARRLSNRYTSKSPVVSPKQEALKLRPVETKTEEAPNVPERIEGYTQLSKSITEQNGEDVKAPDKTSPKADIRGTEVTALNMEVETLRWQLAQTEANRQMHIALLKQIVTFLNRVRDHIDNQKIESPRKDTMSARIAPRSFNVADLPRSRSVLHVNKNVEYASPNKKISTRKISKSISNVNGYKDCAGIWNQPKFPLVSEKETAQKISEEMSRLITLANTVLSTKIPDLACSCNESTDSIKQTDINERDIFKTYENTTSLSLIEEDTSNTLIQNKTCSGKETFNDFTHKYIDAKDSTMNDYIVPQSTLTCGLENSFASVELNEKERESPLSVKNAVEFDKDKPLRSSNDKRNEYNHVINFIEDESGFSSMSSFQEIGIPIISIIPPSPCKVSYIEEIPDFINESEKWKTDALELDKQTVKVFWV